MAIHDAPTIDDARLGAFLNRAVDDLGATMGAVLVVIGDKLGLYKALAARGPLTPAALAAETGLAERYVREWLGAQAAANYISYANGHFSLTPEQAYALADDDSPVFLPGAFQVATGASRIAPKLMEAFQSGAGVGIDEHDPDLFDGTERFFRAGYKANLVSKWIPALEGVEGRLRSGARVVDVGCGHGASTILLAQAFPGSTFLGVDIHAPSIAEAIRKSEAAGVADRVQFQVASAKAYPGRGYDLVACFDSLHDMGDPVGAARHVLASLAADATWLIVEPFAGDHVEDNLTPVGRLYYSASTLICTPASLAQEVGTALGAQAGEARLHDVVTAAGFTRFRRAAETPFNIVYEARP